ncbi:MAG TPA: GspE/PulE family protein [Phycisphaerae bacterium]|nr:GspE/PulE family protein [Phycisphaerae bacterium]
MRSNRTDKPEAVVQLVDELIGRALSRRASDVHFEPAEQALLIRYRIDGQLQDVERVPVELAPNVIGRLKVLGRLLTYRTDVPQEGRIEANGQAWPGQADMRLAVFPTIRGERAVVRLFYYQPEVVELNELGLAETDVDRLRTAVSSPQGLLIVTGPAGAGKTTTLYALVRHILQTQPGRSVVTLEDPVEQRLSGVAQIEVKPFGELTYPRAMRSLLRQDPQVLLLGEIRDAETAGIAVEAALAGHLILTTMHSGDPAEALVRLLEMKLPPYQITSSVALVWTQRLVRLLCEACRRSTGDERHPFEPAGCPQCDGSGCRGRTACASWAAMADSLREAILASADAAALRLVIAQQGSSTLAADALRHVRAGRTTLDELRRVVPFGNDAEFSATES